jgi:nitrogen fixation NifU-like protein
MSLDQELYQQVILEHNKKPRNYRKLDPATHSAEGFNPLCGDHLWIFMNVVDGVVEDVTFQGDGCAISKASASMMTGYLKGKSVSEAQQVFKDFHKLVIGELKPETDPHSLGRLTIFSGIWKYPSRVKCAALAWHTMNGALTKQETISTE